jgi:uncharacterized membrane protein YfcA
MSIEVIVLIMLGALAGGLVNGLTGFGTGLVALGFWLHVLSPPIAAALVTICSVVAHVQNLPVIRHAIDWRGVMPFIAPGLAGVPLGAWLLARIDADPFKMGIGALLVAYASFALSRRAVARRANGHVASHGAIGFIGGVLGGLAGLSGLAPIVWTDHLGWSKEHRRVVLQLFNLVVLAAAFVAFAWSGLLGAAVGLAALIALPGTLLGAWAGGALYRRLGDRGYRRIVLVLLLVSGLALIGAGGLRMLT